MRLADNKKILLFAVLIVSVLGMSEAAARFSLDRYELRAELEQGVSGQATEARPELPPVGIFWLNTFSSRYHYLLGKHRENFPTSDDSQSSTSCSEVLSSYQRAIELSPSVARFYVAWAAYAARNSAAVLECQGREVTELEKESLKKSIEQQLQRALELEPFNTVEQYYAAIVQLHIGNKQQALSLLQGNEEQNPLFNQAQRQYFYSLIRNQEDLEIALSNRLPVVAAWIGYFAAEQPEKFSAWQEAFAVAAENSLGARLRQLQADDFALGVLRRDNYYNAALELLNYPQLLAVDSLRQSLDRVLAQYYHLSGDFGLAQLFLQRSELVRVPVAKAIAEGDHLPGSSMLFNWTTDSDRQYLRIGSLGISLGFYLPQGYKAKLLLLESEKFRQRKDLDDFSLRISSDNQEFSLVNKPQSKSLRFLRRGLIAIELPNEEFRYAKLALNSGRELGALRNNLSSLLQVYGEQVGD